ncbi:OmpR family two-component system bacitracin resistance sensor histidine kinase BceS [Fontibacillus phaseoli]|uniref:histidine kinase n=1 Tax=Fontibacillus phaseoli TaxID=1416533 RepID=A0A369BPS5_9BACL|nr:ATP-binding protein [Fontibacillus phaseoli]RCX23632.1 OmpR family two-component system bacitracin resistance sensor histidine kinase BceS [Fontibacillus phaseoli]
MIAKYLRERLSWILLFLALQLLFLSIAALDATIPFKSILYIVFLSVLIFLGFLLVRYQKETKFYKDLESWDNTYDLSSIREPESPFEDMAMNVLNMQTERYMQESSMHRIELEQEKDELLSWIHEVKTPLTTLQLMIERLNDETLKGQMMYEWLRIHLLLDQQLHQKRIPFIQNDVFIEVTALEPLIYGEIRALKSWCLQKGIGFDVSLPVAEVLTDAKWFGFILRQLLTNAVKYSGASDIVIKSGMKDGQSWLGIQDSGRGIDPKDLPRIFDKGFTSTTAHQDSAATGMGLYLAQKVADSLSITIDVISQLGEGTTFTLTFPKKNGFLNLTGM